MSLYKSKEQLAAQPPVPDQMFALAAAAVCAAKQGGRKKASSRAERAHILLPRSREARVTNEQGDYKYHVTHRFLGRIGRTGYRRWSMRITEPYWVCGANDSAWYRSNYAFEWTRESVERATKRIAVSLEDPGEPEDDKPAVTLVQVDSGTMMILGDREDEADELPAILDSAIFNPDLVNAVGQNQIMSGEDCARLIDDVRDFGNQALRSVQYVH